jgi:molybdenum cofactor biosynthesis enzyme MoaA
MKADLFSIVVGTEACNARCPYCVAKMTPGMEAPKVNWRNFNIAARYAKAAGVITAMLTGKGEPTLYPDQITEYLKALNKHEFPLIEMQTNGILLQDEKYRPYLEEWYRQNLATIAISIAHYDAEENRKILVPHKQAYIDLPRLITNLHGIGYNVRLTCVMTDGLIDGPSSLEKLIDFAARNSADQLTVTPVNKPEHSRNSGIESWVEQHYLKDKQKQEIKEYLDKNGHQLMTLSHGAIIYDVRGQNVCLSNCLTLDKKSSDVRQLIFFPNGRLAFDWQYKGAVIM